MPKALGNYVVIKDYLDTNYAVDRANMRSQYGIIIYVNNAPIIWYSESQNMVEDSSFASGFVEIGIETEIIEALWYKLRYFVMTTDGDAEVFCENKAVVNNSIIPTSVLKKRHNTILSQGERGQGFRCYTFWVYNRVF